MWGLVWQAITWLSAGYVVNDVTRTVGQWTDTGEYYEPSAPRDSTVVIDAKNRPFWHKYILWLGIGGLLAWLISSQLANKKK